MSDSVSIGSELASRYTIEREIGEGGMATVYLARDIRHERYVALKFLKRELGAVLGAERFLAEIRVTANLQHPNLLPLFDSGEAAGLLFYVMPFVDGESLRQKLDREKQLPVDEAVRLATAVASALGYAHQRGVIHRDLKPENILLQAGQPVVSDFGIALAVSNAGGARVTQTGLSLGTPQYMSPEQATGDRVIDHRSDVYSLAALTYEMLTGEPPHSANTAQAIIARVLTERPRPVRAVRPAVPDHVAYAVERGLEKLPADRWSTAGEFADALRGRSSIAVPATQAAQASERTSSRRRYAAALVPWVVALAAGAYALVQRAGSREVSATNPVVRFTLGIPDSTRFQMPEAFPLLFSRDGQSIYYTGRAPGGGQRVYERPLSSLTSRPVPGTEGVVGQLMLSPDGRRIAFNALVGPQQASTMRAVELGSGSSVRIPTSAMRGALWLDDGSFIAALASERGISRVFTSGAAPENLTKIDVAQGETSHRDPFLLPDRQTLLFRVNIASGTEKLGILLLDKNEERRLEGEAYGAIGVVDGWLIFGRRDGSIVAAPFDRERTTSIAEPVTLVDGVYFRPAGGTVAALSGNGSLAYVPASVSEALLVVDESGRVVATDTVNGSILDLSYSRDGTQLAFAQVTEAGTARRPRIWLYDARSRVSRLLTDGVATAHAPSWSADGQRVAFVVPNDSGRGEVWWMPADKRTSAKLLLSVPGGDVSDVVFSPDGRHLVARLRGSNGADLYLVPLESPNRTPVPLVATRAQESMPAISPDSRLLAYVSDESGAEEVYVRRFPGDGGSIRVSRRGGFEPQWGRDGKLFYRSGDSVLVATIVTSPSVAVTQVRQLFEIGPRTSLARSQYSVHPGSQRIAFQRRGTSGGLEIVVVTNWAAEVRARLGAKR